MAGEFQGFNPGMGTKGDVRPPLSLDDHNPGGDAMIISPPVRRREGPRVADAAKRTPPEGVNLVLEDMNRKLAKAKAEDPNYNKPMDRGPVEGTRVDRTVSEPFEEVAPREFSNEAPKPGQIENVNTYDEAATHLVSASKGRSDQMKELMAKIPSTDIPKNLNVRKLARELTQDLDVLRTMEKTPGISPKVKAEMQQRAEAIEASLDTITTIQKSFGQEKKVAQAPTRTAPAKALRQPPPSTLPAQAPSAGFIGALKKLKFW